ARHFDDRPGLALKIEPPVRKSCAPGARRGHHQGVSMPHVGKWRRPFTTGSAPYCCEQDHPASEETASDAASTGTEKAEMDSCEQLDGGADQRPVPPLKHRDP